MQFEWDAEKALQNIRKHDVPFPFATRVFLDPNRLEWAGARRHHGEPRWVTIGLVDGIELAVVYTVRGDAIRFISARRQNGMSAKATGTVKFRLNPARPPKLTKRVRDRLAAKPDQAIDFSDIPPTYGVAWTRPGLSNAGKGKRQITLQIDADILHYFQSTGRTYRARMNRVLRSFVDAQRSGRGKSSAP